MFLEVLYYKKTQVEAKCRESILSTWLTLICTEITVIIIRNNHSKTQANNYRNNYSETQDNNYSNDYSETQDNNYRNNYSETQDNVRKGLFDPIQ